MIFKFFLKPLLYLRVNFIFIIFAYIVFKISFLQRVSLLRCYILTLVYKGQTGGTLYIKCGFLKPLKISKIDCSLSFFVNTFKVMCRVASWFCVYVC